MPDGKGEKITRVEVRGGSRGTIVYKSPLAGEEVLSCLHDGCPFQRAIYSDHDGSPDAEFRARKNAVNTMREHMKNTKLHVQNLDKCARQKCGRCQLVTSEKLAKAAPRPTSTRSSPGRHGALASAAASAASTNELLQQQRIEALEKEKAALERENTRLKRESRKRPAPAPLSASHPGPVDKRRRYVPPVQEESPLLTRLGALLVSALLLPVSLFSSRWWADTRATGANARRRARARPGPTVVREEETMAVLGRGFADVVSRHGTSLNVRNVLQAVVSSPAVEESDISDRELERALQQKHHYLQRFREKRHAIKTFKAHLEAHKRSSLEQREITFVDNFVEDEWPTTSGRDYRVMRRDMVRGVQKIP